jgi:hypothetical protein
MAVVVAAVAAEAAAAVAVVGDSFQRIALQVCMVVFVPCCGSVIRSSASRCRRFVSAHRAKVNCLETV